MATKKVTKKATKVTNTKKAVAKKVAKKTAKKVVKKATPKKKVVAKKKVAKKVKPVAKKAVAKKKATKVTLKEKYTKLYKIVSNYSDTLMQDVYSVVYRTKELKRFINTTLAHKYIEQEVLVRLGEHNIKTTKKSRAVASELAAEFE